jgi:predicted GNAT family acetyltransferase
MIVVRPLTPERWHDLETLFSARGCSVARGCWCMYYRVSGAIPREAGERVADASKRAMQALMDGGTVTGLIGYELVGDETDGNRGGSEGGSGMPMRGTDSPADPNAPSRTVSVGWVSLGPREEYDKLQRSPVMRAVDDQPVWSIVCFVVPSEHRGRGVTKELLVGAIAYAREQGAGILEAYPVDLAVPGHASAPWFGSAHMFAEAGFEEVARRRDDRPVMRLRLG